MSFVAFKKKLKNKHREFVGVRLTYLLKNKPFSLQQIKLTRVRVFPPDWLPRSRGDVVSQFY